MCPEENAKALLARLDEMNARLVALHGALKEPRRLSRELEKLARLGEIERELTTARLALAQLIEGRGEPT